ncbi:hypothetical protein GCM10010230_28400 [Streptomyces narbonensis]|uniref:hypothetical protein n=1 Tax=Streptomyces narbonensis TaxID=67333 RepID=UPI00167BCFCC|nr:hypothetical protein [Streptomyces narbonensis]GGW00401.1 hypothetical protein GCM10010230_28400 [Streptomyces narbonensis]
MSDGGRGSWTVRGRLLGAGLLALAVAGVLWALDGEDAAGPIDGASVSAGLMRTSGAVYQFRHREFQEWLVRHPEP